MRRIFGCGVLALALLATATPTLAAPAWGGDAGDTSFTTTLGDWMQGLI